MSSRPWKILHGDCLAEMEWMANESVDSIVTDPPYGLNFMNKHWDYDVPKVDVWRECLRVLKPGGHLLSFFGTRTYHRGVVAIEDAGFEIRDQIAWTYGSGFPKSHNGSWGGTALKPAWEPVVMARKPVVGTVAQNFERYGVGGLNVDGCRVAASQADVERAAVPQPQFNSPTGKIYNMKTGEGRNGDTFDMSAGRFPANLIHDGSDDVLAAFPQAPGQQANASATAPSDKTGQVYGPMKRQGEASQDNKNVGQLGFKMKPGARRLDTGSTARFFKQCATDDIWQDLNLQQENASTADQTSSQQRLAAVSALVLAVNAALPEGLSCLSFSLEPSTSATAIELKKIAESVTQAILTIDSRFWRESKPARLSLSLCHADVVVLREPTGIMTITTSRWKSNGSAENVTFNITPPNLEHGEKVCESRPANRFIYCAKANKKDREADNLHPTVKPTDLMRYLCRLVTPRNGLVFDPFMGSGSTGKAALLEGFRFVGIEREAEYIGIARARLERAEQEGEL